MKTTAQYQAYANSPEGLAARAKARDKNTKQRRALHKSVAWKSAKLDKAMRVWVSQSQQG